MIRSILSGLGLFFIFAGLMSVFNLVFKTFSKLYLVEYIILYPVLALILYWLEILDNKIFHPMFWVFLTLIIFIFEPLIKIITKILNIKRKTRKF